MQPLKCQRLFSHFIGVKMNRHGGIGHEKGTAARAVRACERRCLRRPWPSAWPSGLFLEKLIKDTGDPLPGFAAGREFLGFEQQRLGLGLVVAEMDGAFVE